MLAILAPLAPKAPSCRHLSGQVALTWFASIMTGDKKARHSPFLGSAFEGMMAWELICLIPDHSKHVSTQKAFLIKLSLRVRQIGNKVNEQKLFPDPAEFGWQPPKMR